MCIFKYVGLLVSFFFLPIDAVLQGERGGDITELFTSGIGGKKGKNWMVEIR